MNKDLEKYNIKTTETKDISTLSRDILKLIFSFLTLKDKFNTAKVAKNWNTLFSDNLLWKSICDERKISISEEGIKEGDYKRACISYLTIKKTLYFGTLYSSKELEDITTIKLFKGASLHENIQQCAEHTLGAYRGTLFELEISNFQFEQMQPQFSERLGSRNFPTNKFPAYKMTYSNEAEYPELAIKKIQHRYKNAFFIEFKKEGSNTVQKAESADKKQSNCSLM